MTSLSFLGLNPYSLSNRNVAVFMSTHVPETNNLTDQEFERETMFIIGQSKALMSNRVSFALNLKGMSLLIFKIRTSPLHR